MTFNTFFDKVVDKARQIPNYKAKSDKKQLTEDEKVIEKRCDRIKNMLTSIKGRNEHNGASTWTGKDIDNILAKVNPSILIIVTYDCRSPVSVIN